MERINVLILEDTKTESDALQRILDEHQFNIIGIAKTHQEALQLFFSGKADVVIIDIFINGVPEGINFAETINAVPQSARPFVFLTSSTDRSIFERAKLTKPFSFLLKPFNPLEVIYALEMAIEKFYGQEDALQSEEEDTVVSSDYFFIKKKDTLKKVAVADIVNIEVEERYCTIHTLSDKFVIQISLAKIMEVLDPVRFCRTHRNHIVNIDCIQEIQPSDHLLLMSNKQLVPVGDRYRDVLQQFRIIR